MATMTAVAPHPQPQPHPHPHPHPQPHAPHAHESKGVTSPAPEPPTPKFTTRTPLASPLAESGWKTSAYFGLHLFDKHKLLSAVDAETGAAFKSALDNATPVPLSAADVIAKAILKWATALGATHYTHWFQPLTAVTAEKHDTFMDLKRDGTAITRFEGKHLVRGEPDGSSFPSGGLRATHCARGYTAWDPSSPPFIMDNGNGTTLYIPAVFFSWADNQALDDKIPLLRSEIALARESLALLHEIGESQHTIFKCDSGLEQEYFLIDRQFYLKRPDLILANRTLMGAAPPKGQQMDDHYFAATSRRFQDLIHEFEVSMWRLGIPLQTRHKEVAPGQYEVAPRFAEASVATDRNLLMMSQLKAIATKHGMAALLHEKPFKGVNGSGKHNNWSFGTNAVPSLLEPGDHPERDSRFMLFLAATLRGLDIHSDLMRIAISGAGNDHRLGANEAPPAIVSAYLGDDIDLAVKKFVRGDKSPPTVELKVDLGVGFLPPLTRAATDRNRTSTFAFTGNKFEFRAVGSSQTPSRSNQILNTMLADSVRHMTGQIKALKAAGMSTAEAVEKVARDTLVAHERIIFNGNGYSAEWPIEAKRRGLLNLRTTPDALALYATDKNIRLHESLGVLTRAELVARSHVFYEEYVKRIDLEARVFNSMTLTGVIPAAVDYAVRLGLLSAPGPAVLALAGRVRAATEAALNGTTAITRALHDLHLHDSVEKSARHAESVLLPLITSTREAVDELETLLPADKWPFPTYHDMLFNQE